MPLIDLASDIGTAGRRSTIFQQNFSSAQWLDEFELNALQAWTIRTSTDPVRMSVAWAQLIHIILVTFFAGNSFIRLFVPFLEGAVHYIS